jgi:hypothetical protein
MKRTELRTIIREEASKVLKEMSASSDIESIYRTLGYDSFEYFMDDNPGLVDAIIDWAIGVPEFRSKLERAGFI